MRKTGPILILVIGVLALFIDFFPNLRLPDGSAEGGRLVETKLGLDLQGGLRVEYQAQQVGDKIPGPADLAVIRQIIEARVNSTGVSEPLITTQGSDRIPRRFETSPSRQGDSTSCPSGRPRSRSAT
jgi:preprotein translocase subunit SecD